jgi:hypothetical protein
MFYRKDSNQYITEGMPFTIDGVQYPSNWLNLSTAEDKAAIGLEEVVATNAPADQKYYWVSEVLNGAEKTYTNTPKDLDDCKAQAVSEAKTQAYSLLQPTDYVEVRNLKDPTYKPEWVTWRDSVRSACTARVAEIATVKDVDELAALGNINWPADPSQGV